MHSDQTFSKHVLHEFITDLSDSNISQNQVKPVVMNQILRVVSKFLIMTAVDSLTSVTARQSISKAKHFLFQMLR